MILSNDRMLNDEGTLTPDDHTLKDMSRALGTSVRVCGYYLEELFKAVSE